PPLLNHPGGRVAGQRKALDLALPSLQEDELLRTWRTIACDHKLPRDQMMKEVGAPFAVCILCVSSRAKRSTQMSPLHICPPKVEQISRESDDHFSLMFLPYFFLVAA
ncbi:hypothetical protein ILYODFUR_034155, partial [Ilyodon furcidens]